MPAFTESDLSSSSIPKTNVGQISQDSIPGNTFTLRRMPLRWEQSLTNVLSWPVEAAPAAPQLQPNSDQAGQNKQ